MFWGFQGKFSTWFNGSASNMAQTCIWTVVPCIPKIGPLQLFLNFWRIFENWKIGVFGYVLMFSKEILHMVQLIWMTLGTGMDVNSSPLHTGNGIPGIIFQFLANFWKLENRHILLYSEVFQGKGWTWVIRWASNMAETCIWTVVPCIPEMGPLQFFQFLGIFFKFGKHAYLAMFWHF